VQYYQIWSVIFMKNDGLLFLYITVLTVVS